jgi:hypothetical protein
MSDLAPFVAAVIRDKVVTEQQCEIKSLRFLLEKERKSSRRVSITGPRGKPIFAESQFDDGNFDYSPELWKVEFSNSRMCSLTELRDMEVRIGGICKARFGNGIVEGFVNDIYNNYDETKKSGTVSIWFGGSSGIWLNISIGGIEREQYASLRDFDLGGENLLNTLFQFWDADSNVYFKEVSFLISYIDGAMDNWGISQPPPTAQTS